MIGKKWKESRGAGRENYKRGVAKRSNKVKERRGQKIEGLELGFVP